MTPSRMVGLLLGTLGLVVLPAAPALAHTEQVSVSPAPGSSTTGSVPAVEIDFSDKVLRGVVGTGGTNEPSAAGAHRIA